ncbi:NDR1/HIN1-like protein 2 [Telopea speciosissima]|uniref:NDR1/HIN1-like protein 2 n=1 Tax=Telopea speciosissima TaxID=54955 RepID=UPI001CC4575D|nr:NDR1/HIN1-like protein 2 [Telopea speciosissima]
MSTTGEIPTHTSATSPSNQPTKRDRRPRYHVQQVRESLTKRVVKCLCGTLLTLLLVVGILGFILWLSLRPHRPRFHSTNFLFPALAQDNGFDNAQITFNVTIRNPNQNMGVYYYSMEGEVYYREQRIGATPLSLPSSFPYYQESKSTIWIPGQLSVPTTLVVNDLRWTELMEDRATGTVWFRLELTSRIRFKISMWESKPHRMHATCHVAVGQDGLILPVSKGKRYTLYFS